MIAAIAASATLWVIAINHEGTTKDSLAAGGFAANGYGDHSPGQYNLFAGLVIEIVLTAIFLSSSWARPTNEPRKASPRSPSASPSP